jgi:hippurate hydrolase
MRLFVLAAVALATPAKAQDGAAARQWIDAALVERQADLAAVYSDLHAHPEVAFAETRSAALLAGRMRELGFAVTEGVGQTGLVAVLENGPGPTVLVRTDMDALPMEEKTGLPYASTAPGVMHACGHDLHMAWWLGAAQVLAGNRAAWRGTLVFIGQPAEEGLRGALAMLADGLYTRFPRPDLAIAAHSSNAAAGAVTVKDGVVASASDGWEIVFHGRGGHGSMPSQTIDPVVIAARFVTDVQSVVARERPENAFGVITVGSFQAGTAANIIPDSATLRLTLRAFDPSVRTLLNAGMQRVARASAAMAGAPEPTMTHFSAGAPLVNDSAAAARAMGLLGPALGDQVTFVPAYLPGVPPSEDFAFLVAPEQPVPGLFLNVGVYDPAVLADLAARGEPVPANHSPYFAPDPALAIAPGARALALAVLSAAGT